MGAGYKAYGTNTLASSPDTALTVIGNASAARRHWIDEIIIGILGTPSDNNSDWVAQRCTVEGTATGVTPTKDDPADIGATANVGENHTVEPTYTSAEELLELPMNHRGTFRWVAPSPIRRLVTPATTNAGVGVKTGHASATVDYGVQMAWEE